MLRIYSHEPREEKTFFPPDSLRLFFWNCPLQGFLGSLAC
jgi:hypothetical protein